jgi:hypothetical protein
MLSKLALELQSGKRVSRVTPTLARWLRASGIASSLLYAAMLIFVPLLWTSYDSASFTVSELSAIGAPTRPLWVPLGTLWALLYLGFGFGVWFSADSNRALRVLATLIIAAGVLSLFWPPMHLREVLAAGGETLTDRLHLVWTAVNGLLTLLAVGFAAAALGKPFRLFSVVILATLVLAGAATSASTSGVAANLPTPWIGVWERLNIGAWLLWVAVLSLVLIERARRAASTPTFIPRADRLNASRTP